MEKLFIPKGINTYDDLFLFQAVQIPKDREDEKKEKFKINQFNLLASEMIALNRSLSDVRLSA